MGCVDSKEKALDHHHPYHLHHPQQARQQRQGQRPPQHRQRQGQPHPSDGGQPGRPRPARAGGAGQEYQGARRSSSSSTSSSVERGVARGVARDRDRERLVVTDPRGARRQQPEEEAGPGLGKRNQFDRASQLRRSKKRKKSRENSVLEISRISDASSGQSHGSPTKTSAKDIAIQETVKTLKNHSASQSQLNASSESDRRWDWIILTR